MSVSGARSLQDVTILLFNAFSLRHLVNRNISGITSSITCNWSLQRGIYSFLARHTLLLSPRHFLQIGDLSGLKIDMRHVSTRGWLCENFQILLIGGVDVNSRRRARVAGVNQNNNMSGVLWLKAYGLLFTSLFTATMYIIAALTQLRNNLVV